MVAVDDGVPEVFSLMRDSDLAPDEYLDRFFSAGSEQQDEVGPSQDPA